MPSATRYNTALVLAIAYMKRLLLITDPLGGAHSVQFELMESLSAYLKQSFDTTVMSIFIDKAKINSLKSLGINAISVHSILPFLNRMFKLLNSNNESMLWLESWLREGFFSRNSRELQKFINSQGFDYVINATTTVPVDSDIWWIQGPPLIITLRGMVSDNYLAKAGIFAVGPFVRRIDIRLIEAMRYKSSKCLAGSGYVRDVLRLWNVEVDGVVYSTKNFSNFTPTTNFPSRDFMLVYIGKETDIFPIEKIAENGVKIIGFGSKLPIGTRLEKLKKLIDFKGFVSMDQLRVMYTNALVTLFPFSIEALGYIPIESMACGTPVLTYNNQGPAETVVNGETGWLVENGEEFIEKALDLWKSKSTGITQKQCVDRATFFTAKNSARLLAQYLDRAPEGK